MRQIKINQSDPSDFYKAQSMKYTFFIRFTIFIIFLTLTSCAFVKVPADPIEVRVTGVIQSSGPSLNIEIKNISKKPQEILLADLPWRDGYSLFWTFIGVSNLTSQETTTRPLPLGNFGPSRMTLMPGESTSGKVDLESTLSGMDRLCQLATVLVFWSFDPMDEGLVARHGGWVSFDKGCKAVETRKMHQ